MNPYLKTLCGFLGIASLSACGPESHSSFKTLKKQNLIHNLSEKDLTKKFIQTSAGRVAYYQTSGKSIPIILIHGNSCSKEYMIKQLDGLGLGYTMIAIDLPGHGESPNALNPDEDYTMPGYARVVADIIQNLSLGKVILLGWSLGGHIAMEAMFQTPELIKGVLVVAAPPMTPSEEGFSQAYLPTYSSPHGMKEEPFTEEDVKDYVTQGGIDLDKHPLLIKASMRTHGLARVTMVKSALSGKIADERKVVETSPVPIGFILGEKEHAVNNDYVKSLKYKNLTMMKILRGGHDCHWSHAKEFNRLFERFYKKITK